MSARVNRLRQRTPALRLLAIVISFALALSGMPMRSQAQGSLPLFVYKLIRSPYDAQVARAWTGAMVLLFIVLVLFVIARVLAGRQIGDDSIFVRRFRKGDE